MANDFSVWICYFQYYKQLIRCYSDRRKLSGGSSYVSAFTDSSCGAVILCGMWTQAAHANIQDLRQMVFDMDSEVKVTIDKHSSQEQDFKKLGFQVLDIVINVMFAQL